MKKKKGISIDFSRKVMVNTSKLWAWFLSFYSKLSSWSIYSKKLRICYLGKMWNQLDCFTCFCYSCLFQSRFSRLGISLSSLSFESLIEGGRIGSEWEKIIERLGELSLGISLRNRGSRRLSFMRSIGLRLKILIRK